MTVRRLKPALLLQLAAMAAVAAVVITQLDFPPLLIAAAAVLGLAQLWPAALVLKVDDSGMRLGRAFVPWGSIDSVVTDGEEVGVRLRHDAPLPRHAGGVIRNPDGTASVAPDLRVRVPGLDRVALTAAVGSHAPLHQSSLA